METYELQLFIHNVEDIESWIADMEGQLASGDHGKDLISVNNLLKKHAVLCVVCVLCVCVCVCVVCV